MSNIVVGSAKDEWSTGVRCDFRAGGEEIGEFDVLAGTYGMHKLRISAILIDTITITSEMTPASTPGSQTQHAMEPDPSLRYGRTFFSAAKGHVGIATPGVEAGDEVAIVVGGDVPIVIRPCGVYDDKKAYKLLCECYVLDEAVMHGEIVRANWTTAKDIILL